MEECIQAKFGVFSGKTWEYAQNLDVGHKQPGVFTKISVC